MAKHLRWLPSFPKTDVAWPWPDGRPHHVGFMQRDFDTAFAQPLRQRLFNARPWLGRVTIENGSIYAIVQHQFRTLGYITAVPSGVLLSVLYQGDFVDLFVFEDGFTQGLFLHYPIVSTSLSNIEPPIDVDPPLGYRNAAFPDNVLIRYPRPPRWGRWNQTRWSWCHTFLSPPNDPEPAFLRAAWEFHFVNGCWAGFDESWHSPVSTDVPEITGAQESILVTALENEGFAFDPEHLIYDYPAP